MLSCLLGKTPLNAHMLVSMVVLIAGITCSCIPLWGYEHRLNSSSVAVDIFLPNLSQLLGVFLVLMSAAAAAGRAVLEETIMLEEDLLSPFTFGAATCALSSILVVGLLITAQLIPGSDHGVQVRPERFFSLPLYLYLSFSPSIHPSIHP